MNKTLVYVGSRDYMALEQIVSSLTAGDEVFVVLCDSNVGICYPSPFCSHVGCNFCNLVMKTSIRKLKHPNRIHYVSLGSLIKPSYREIAENAILKYNNVKELKEITYKGVEIGYGAFSTFVSFTRNVMPSFNEELHRYLDYILRSEIILTETLLAYVDEIGPNTIVFHNGRFSNYKPIYNIAQIKGINYIATENYPLPSGEVRMDNFYNSVPHSFDAIAQKMEDAWANGDDNKISIAKDFFCNRRNAKYAGDTIYTKDQQIGQLPSGFDPHKRNIAIFNSSEDEYFAISKDFDEAVIFPNQYMALKTIFDKYQNDSTIHFYLRIHPNLKNVPYKSHMMLYDLKYDNVTIIPPTSSVSTYTLMDSVEKVIVFNSTTGLESAYWGKPVIALNRCAYSGMGIAHEPKSKEEVFELINEKNLPNLVVNKENCYKVAYYLLGYATAPHVYVPTKKTAIKSAILKKQIFEYSSIKFWGSSRLESLITGCLLFLCNKGVLSRFSGSIREKTK